MPTLDWLNRDAAFRTADQVPYRLLQAVSAHGDGDARNLLVQGDNLQALKAMLPLYWAQVKCIFIDPPYNTKNAFEHYDDNLEHSQWLSSAPASTQICPTHAAPRRAPEPRIQRQAARDGHALALAAAEFVRVRAEGAAVQANTFNQDALAMTNVHSFG